MLFICKLCDCCALITDICDVVSALLTGGLSCDLAGLKTCLIKDSLLFVCQRVVKLSADQEQLRAVDVVCNSNEFVGLIELVQVDRGDRVLLSVDSALLQS